MELILLNNEIEKITAYYVWWNNLVEQKSMDKEYIRLQLTDAIKTPLFDFININQPENLFTNTKINSWKKRNHDLCLSDIPNGNIKKEFVEMIEKFFSI